MVYHTYHFYTPALGQLDNPFVLTRNPALVLLIEGHTAVALFMSLSGFLFTLIAFRKRLHYGLFMFNRLLRIYPMYLFICMVALYTYGGKPQLSEVVVTLLYLQTFRLPYLCPSATIHLWSICIEEQFYILFPFIIRFFSHYGYRYILGILCLTFLVRGYVMLETGTAQRVAYWSLVGRLDQFLMGLVAGRLFLERSRWFSHPLLLLAALLLAWLALFTFHLLGGLGHNLQGAHWLVWQPIEGACWALVILCYCSCRWHIPRILSQRLAALGRLTYSVYVLHWSFVSILAPRLALPLSSNPWVNGVLNGVMLTWPLTLAVATLTYFVIERPFMSLRRRYILPEVAPGSS